MKLILGIALVWQKRKQRNIGEISNGNRSVCNNTNDEKLDDHAAGVRLVVYQEYDYRPAELDNTKSLPINHKKNTISEKRRIAKWWKKDKFTLKYWQRKRKNSTPTPPPPLLLLQAILITRSKLISTTLNVIGLLGCPITNCQEPISWSVQLPYSVCEYGIKGVSKVGLLLVNPSRELVFNNQLEANA